MKSVFLVASLLVFIPSADAQVAASLSRSPDHTSEINIRNDAPVDLVAFGVLAKVRGGELTVAAYYEPPMAALKPGEERAMKVSIPCGGGRPEVGIGAALRKQSMKRFLCEFDQPIVAGIFADGSTSGDAQLLTRIMLRRSSTLLAVETALDILSDAGRHNLGRDQLVEQFQKMADSLNRWYLLPEQEAGREIYQTMAGKLKNLPEVPIGSAFPSNVFVERETTALREQRQTLLEAVPDSIATPSKPILLSFR